MPELSILIPARNEEWLQKTIDDIFEHVEADTEVIVGLDGDIRDMEWLDKHTQRFKRLGVFDIAEPIGQRAMTNRLAKLSTSRFVAKLDAHCSFAQGFDRVLLSAIDDRTIMTPMLCRLDAKEWNIIAQPFRSEE